MDGFFEALLETGVMRIVTEEEAAKTTFDAIISGEDDDPSLLSDPTGRFKTAEQVLQS